MTTNTDNVVRIETAPVYELGAPKAHPAPDPSMDAAMQTQSTPDSGMFVIWYNVDRRFVGTFVMPDDWHTAHAAMIKAAITSALKVDAVSALLIHNAPVGSINECREFFIWGIANCLQTKLEMVGITMDKAITIRSTGEVVSIL